MIATFIRFVDTSPQGTRQELFSLDPPLKGNTIVSVSMLSRAFDTGDPETLIFPAQEDGWITSIKPLGELYGATDANKALENAGYTVIRE